MILRQLRILFSSYTANTLARNALFTAALLCLASVPASAVTYEFNFDNIDDGTLMAPFVGFGEVSFNGEPLVDGSYPMLDFSNIEMGFDFASVTSFTEADIATPTDEVLFVISNGGQTFNFGSTGYNGSGPFGGSIDFFKDDMTFGLSTEPPGTGGNLDRYFVGDIPNMTTFFFGNYAGTLVPEPSGLALALASTMLIVALRKRRVMR